MWEAFPPLLLCVFFFSPVLLCFRFFLLFFAGLLLTEMALAAGGGGEEVLYSWWCCYGWEEDGERSLVSDSVLLLLSSFTYRCRSLPFFKWRSCWWEKPLVVVLKHSEGIKHTVLFQETNSLQTQKAYNTHPFFSL